MITPVRSIWELLGTTDKDALSNRYRGTEVLVARDLSIATCDTPKNGQHNGVKNMGSRIVPRCSSVKE